MIKKEKSGLTLVEVIMTIGILTIVLLAVSQAVLMFYRSNNYVVDQAVTINNARKGMEALSRDIREATYGDDGSFPVSAIGQQSFTFFSDIDGDIGIERVRYFVNGADGTLRRGIIDAAGLPLSYNPASEIVTIIAGDVRNIALATTTFRYYNEAGAEIVNFSNVTEVAHVRLNLIINVNPQTAPNDFMLRSSATIRNLKTNL